jgi:hypothetical protein
MVAGSIRKGNLQDLDIIPKTTYNDQIQNVYINENMIVKKHAFKLKFEK